MKYHFIGIKGSGMSALAQIMHDLGYEVQGSDVSHHLFTQDALEARGIEILDFDESNIEKDMIVVIGAAFDDNNIEVKKTIELGVKKYTYFEFLAELIEQYESLSVCGCHGKTTTTALLSHVLNNIEGTNYLIGDGTGHAKKKNKYFMMEACEYKRNFLHYFPKYIIMTNIELDHVDYYKDLNDLKDAYTEFGTHCKKLIIACGDDENIRSLDIDKVIIYYGFNEDNDVVAKNVVLDDKGSSFDVYYKGKHLGYFDIPLYGKHMILNTLSVITFAYLRDLDMDLVKKSIKTFKGAKRRFKENVINDIITIDDYAHHPTEVKVTIKAARQKYPNKEIISVFLENTFSRTALLYKDFAAALNLSDKSYVTDIFSDREKQEEYPNVTPKLITDLLNNGEHLKIGTFDQLIDSSNYECIKPLLEHKDAVVIFMGCKEVYYLKEKFESALGGVKK